MRELLEKKYLEETPSYEEKELVWLLEHIGDSEAAIRDDLVFNSLARGLQEELFTREQVRFLIEESLSEKGLEFKAYQTGLPTLTRSFTALLYANFLYVDRSQSSLYFHILEEEEVHFVIEQALQYLNFEEDMTAFSEEFGWVHAFAHGADLLAEAVCHPVFSPSRFPEVLAILEKLFRRVTIRFVADEEWRLARVLYQPVLEGRLAQDVLAGWLQSQEFTFGSQTDFYRFSNFRSMLLEVFVQLSAENSLSEELKAVILTIGY